MEKTPSAKAGQNLCKTGYGDLFIICRKLVCKSSYILNSFRIFCLPYFTMYLPDYIFLQKPPSDSLRFKSYYIKIINKSQGVKVKSAEASGEICLYILFNLTKKENGLKSFDNGFPANYEVKKDNILKKCKPLGCKNVISGILSSFIQNTQS